jgi:hypothetical protein
MTTETSGFTARLDMSRPFLLRRGRKRSGMVRAGWADNPAMNNRQVRFAAIAKFAGVKRS